MSRSRLAILLVLAVCLPLPSGAQADAAAGWVGTPTLIGGTSRYDAGEWIYTDFVYDDYGADTVPAGQPNVVSLASTTGDFRYPNGTTQAGNAADVVEVRARANGDDLEVRVLLQSIVDTGVPALWVAANGAETVVTKDNADVDPDANTISFTLPGAAAGDELVLNVGAGLNDGYGGLRAGVPGYAQANPGEFTTGAPTDARLFDLAFNTHAIEGRGAAWNEAVQSASLAAGDLARFAQTIDLAALRAGASTPVPALTGYQVRIFASRQALGEGMAPSFPQYRGTWQPYAMWIPASYDDDAPAPLFLNLHSLSVHHNQYRGGTPSSSYRALYEQYEAAIGAIVVTPLGRGPDGWYKDEALVDTLEVWADVLKNFNVDAERVYVGGYSMGGYGTYRLTTLMPDAFASAVSVVGPPSNGIWAYPGPEPGGAGNPDNTRPQLENTRHIPFWITHGMGDELVPFTGVVHQADRFDELGHTYRFALHPVADHFLFAYADHWARESAWFAAHARRVTDPDRVTLKVRPRTWARADKPQILPLLQALTAEVGARLDGAYWVGDVAVAGDPAADVTASVDLTSGGIALRDIGTSTLATAGVDGPTPYVLTGKDRATDVGGPVEDVLTGSLANVAALTIDVGRAGLSNAPDLSGIATDGPVVVRLVRDGVQVNEVTIGA